MLPPKRAYSCFLSPASVCRIVPSWLSSSEISSATASLRDSSNSSEVTDRWG